MIRNAQVRGHAELRRSGKQRTNTLQKWRHLGERISQSTKLRGHVELVAMLRQREKWRHLGETISEMIRNAELLGRAEVRAEGRRSVKQRAKVLDAWRHVCEGVSEMVKEKEGRAALASIWGGVQRKISHNLAGDTCTAPAHPATRASDTLHLHGASAPCTAPAHPTLRASSRVRGANGLRYSPPERQMLLSTAREDTGAVSTARTALSIEREKVLSSLLAQRTAELPRQAAQWHCAARRGSSAGEWELGRMQRERWDERRLDPPSADVLLLDPPSPPTGSGMLFPRPRDGDGKHVHVGGDGGKGEVPLLRTVGEVPLVRSLRQQVASASRPAVAASASRPAPAGPALGSWSGSGGGGSRAPPPQPLLTSYRRQEQVVPRQVVPQTAAAARVVPTAAAARVVPTAAAVRVVPTAAAARVVPPPPRHMRVAAPPRHSTVTTTNRIPSSLRL